MIRIDTTIEPRKVEIDDREYTVAPRTIKVCDQLLDIEKAHVGKPAYRLKLAELRVLLGDAAHRQLFKGKDGENVDRIDMIYRAVSRAFTQNEEDLDAQDAEDKAQTLASSLAPLNELLRNLNAVNRRDEGEKPRQIPMIHRDK